MSAADMDFIVLLWHRPTGLCNSGFLVQVISKVMETFQPSAVALQCGSDSLSGDRLGCFNLTIKGKSTLLLAKQSNQGGGLEESSDM